MSGRVVPALLAAGIGVLGFPLATHAAPRPSLPDVRDSAHFRVFYDAAAGTGARADAVSAGLEAAWERLVAGGAHPQNVGLRVPVDDAGRGGDGRVDAYVHPITAVGYAVPDDSGGSMFMEFAPSVTGSDRPDFVAAHEFMHVLQNAYRQDGPAADPFIEGSADWAAHRVTGLADAGVVNWLHTWTPLECTDVWEGASCNLGYWTSLFLTMLTERYGDAVVRRFYERFDELCVPPTDACRRGLGALDDVLADPAIGSSTGAEFAEWTARVWDPTLWTTALVANLQSRMIGPGAFRHGVGDAPVPAPDGALSATAPHAEAAYSLDHLASRHVRFRLTGVDASGPGDRLRIAVRAESPAIVPPLLLTRGPAGGRRRTAMTLVADGPAREFAEEVPFDPARDPDVVLVLANASETVDDAPVSWSAQLLPGPPTPPAADSRTTAAPLRLGEATTIDAVHAGGTRAEAPPGCPETDDATRGVWLRFVAPATARYRFSLAGTDFRPAVMLVAGEEVLECGRGWPSDTAIESALERGATYDLWVARDQREVGIGHRVVAAVTGPGPAPPAPPPPVSRVRTALSAPGQVRRRVLLTRGLRVRCRLDRAGVCAVELRLPAAAARALGISRSGNRAAVLAHREARVRPRRPATMTLRLLRRVAVAALARTPARGARPLVLNLRATGRAGRSSSTVQRTLRVLR